MEPEVTTDGGVTVVTLHGDVDVARGIGLRDLLAEIFATPGGAVVVDVTDVRFLDSSGVGLLVTSHRRAKDDGRAFAIAGAADAVRRTLQLTRTDRILELHETIDAALAAHRR
jgi:anti-sigma B factor antagonist